MKTYEQKIIEIQEAEIKARDEMIEILKRKIELLKQMK